jgi:hypothetical protein
MCHFVSYVYLSTAIVMAGFLAWLGPAFCRLLPQPSKKAARITGLNFHRAWTDDGSLLLLHFSVEGRCGRAALNEERKDNSTMLGDWRDTENRLETPLSPQLWIE